LESFLDYDHARIVWTLKKTNVADVFEWRKRIPEGGLRVIFTWGKGVLWCLGSFIKTNEREGDRELRRYAASARAAKQTLPPP